MPPEFWATFFGQKARFEQQKRSMRGKLMILAEAPCLFGSRNAQLLGIDSAPQQPHLHF